MATALDRSHRLVRRLHADETGDSPITSIAGVMIFLGFLLLAAQTAIHLYAVSTSTSIAFDEARRVAAAVTTGGYDCASAESAVRTRLGRWGHELTVTCTGDDTSAEQVAVRLVGPSPANLVGAFGDATGLDTFDRTVRVRTERFATGGTAS
jgi:hypothetical protein